METRIVTTAITIISSIIVKPRLPLRIGCSISCFLRRFRIYLKDVLTAPSVGFGIVLSTALSPFSRVGKRVARDATQKADLLIDLALHLYAFDKNFQALRVSFVAHLPRREHFQIGSVFVLVDGHVDLAKGKDASDLKM